MKENKDLKIKVLMAARDNGINSILFRNALARKLGLNITESACISLLGITGISSPKELAHFTGLTTGSTTTMLDRLEKKNIIRRKSNPKDRRGVLIEFTTEYNEIAKSLVSGIQKSHRELIDTFTDKELEIVVNFLNRFTKNIVEHTKRLEKK
jgi:DNA-binding MarR family transcriptional regulator